MLFQERSERCLEETEPVHGEKVPGQEEEWVLVGVGRGAGGGKAKARVRVLVKGLAVERMSVVPKLEPVSVLSVEKLSLIDGAYRARRNNVQRAVAL